ncbi:MAG: T9SS type A sorting domain-containing protein [Bacteroidota bacterium]
MTNDNGINWITIGNDTTGKNWYNTKNLFSRPDQNSGVNNSYGWTGRQKQWYKSAYALDDLPINAQTRFRFVFKSIDQVLPNQSNNGFAIDNLFIGNRARKILTESYEQAQNWDYFQLKEAFLEDFAEDIVPIYFPIGENNQDFLSNPNEILARSVHYGISTNDRTVLGGNDYSNLTDSLRYASFDTSRLELPPFHIELDSISGILVSAQDDYPFPTRILVAITEDVDRDNRTMQHVFRKFLPSANGTLKESWLKGESKTLELNWGTDMIPGPGIIKQYDALSIIVWIEDLVSGEVFNAEVSPIWEDIVSAKDVNREELPGEKTDNFSRQIFPNPATDHIFIIHPEINKGFDLQISLYDLSGKQVYVWPLSANNHLEQIQLPGIVPGFYIATIKENGQIIFQEKLSITN